jgi:hypothetical protein
MAPSTSNNATGLTALAAAASSSSGRNMAEDDASLDEMLGINDHQMMMPPLTSCLESMTTCFRMEWKLSKVRAFTSTFVSSLFPFIHSPFKITHHGAFEAVLVATHLHKHHSLA